MWLPQGRNIGQKLNFSDSIYVVVPLDGRRLELAQTTTNHHCTSLELIQNVLPSWHPTDCSRIFLALYLIHFLSSEYICSQQQILLT